MAASGVDGVLCPFYSIFHRFRQHFGRNSNDRFRSNAAPNCDFFVMKRHFLNLLSIFSGVNTGILLIYGPIQCEMGFIGHDNFVVSDLASLSKVMELPAGSVEYGQPCTS